MLISCVSHKETVYLQQYESKLDGSSILREQPQSYRIQIHDILSIRLKVLDQDNVSIFNPISESGALSASSAERAYFDGFTVNVHGQIKIPVLGFISVLGHTTEDVEEHIRIKLLEEHFKETANIFVTVKLSGFRYTALGEIAKPGTVTLFQNRVNIFEALANVGDVTAGADRQQVQIVRQYPYGQQIHVVDLTDVAVMESPFYYIQPNDMVYVKPLKQKSWGTGVSARENVTTVVTILGLLATTLLLINRL